ncbi:hypothetical protein ACIGXI_34405 [Kitasatospora aureofaciens]|uniref:hypothetical protein n=1 Tax=Kitasatospora aureofaciens TaxID=1894 RepID=UPI0037CCBDFD
MKLGRRLPAALITVALAATGLCTTTTAHASTVGGQIAASEMLSRAQSWVSEGVPYNQGAYKTDANGSYREDCSGFVSMAWHLDQSLVVTTGGAYFTTADGKGNSAYDYPTGAVGDLTGLQPGDAVAYPGQHIFLFNAWTNKATGDFTYYADSNPSDPTHGPSRANIHDQTIEGWPTSGYVGLRYKNIAPAIPAGFNVTVDANGAPLANGQSVSGVVNLTAPPTNQGIINSLYYNFTGPAGPFTINGGAGANNYAQAWNTTGLPNGTYTVQAGANEIDGQSHSYPGTPIRFTVNNTPSTPSANAPGGQVFGSIQVSASGLSGDTTSVTYKVDGTQVGNSTAGGAFPLTIATTTLSDGAHAVTASAVNSLGAASLDSPPVTLTVDNNRSHTASQAAAQSNGTVDLLYKAGDGALGHMFYQSGGTWAASAPVGASMASQPSTVTTSSGVVDSFWEGTDGNLWHATYFPAGPTPGWQPPGNLGMGPLGGAPKAVDSSNGTIDVFWNGGGSAAHLWHAWYNAGGTWNGPQDLTPNISAAGAVTGDPAPVTSAPGVVDVFWKGADNNLWHVPFFPGSGSGSGWQSPSSLGMGPLGGSPKAVGQINGTVDVFWKGAGANPDLWHAWWNQGQPWAGPQDLGGANLQSDPVPVNSAAGVVDVFWQGTDNNLWHLPFFPGSGSGSGWQSPNSLGMGPLGSAPFAAAQPNGTIDVFWKGSGAGSGNIWHAWWNQGQPWAGAQDLGGNIAAN